MIQFGDFDKSVDYVERPCAYAVIQMNPVRLRLSERAKVISCPAAVSTRRKRQGRRLFERSWKKQGMHR
jgi:hypothetical protein